MYFWNIKGLKDDIKCSRFGERERFIYAFIYIVLMTIGFELTMYLPLEHLNHWTISTLACLSASTRLVPISLTKQTMVQRGRTFWADILVLVLCLESNFFP